MSTKEERLRWAREWKARNPEKVKAYRRKYRAENKDRENEMRRLYDKLHPEAKYWAGKRYREKHAQKLKALRSTEEYRRVKNQKQRERYRTDVRYNIEKRLRASFVQALRLGRATKARSLRLLMGCSFEELKRHIERQFVDGMSWDRFEEIHIDHIRPCTTFDLTDVEQQRACFHFTNLQPLWAKDNLSKGSKYTPQASL